ncbi:MAG: cytidyltransferase, partial [Bacteroidales bacterium]|nr:cytidyltransferase [Bacteroidales bacterium]
VKEAYINSGSGIMDFVPTVERIRPDILLVNEDGDKPEKREFAQKMGMEYVVLKRVPADGLVARSSTDIKKASGGIPTRLDLAGTWIDQPYVSRFAPGWAITISLEPTFEVRERCGLSTSTRNVIRKIWPYKLPDMDPEMLARLVFCFENEPERSDGIISGAQDAIGICMPGLVRHWYNSRFWPEKTESCHDETILQWLESHLCMIPMFPRRDGCSVVKDSPFVEASEDYTDTYRIKLTQRLAGAADRCWNAIMKMDLDGFSAAYKDSFNAQTAMFPAMMQPGVQEYIDRYSAEPGVLAWKMPGAGGGGYLALVVSDLEAFCASHPDAIPLTIRRKGE